jgi:ribose 5-phosphate isomerase B
MRIAVGSDHAGYEEPAPHYKPEIMAYLESKGHEVVDCGTNGSDSVDYPDFANKVCDTILKGKADTGVLICGTGIGVCMTANRHPGIRAAVVTNEEMAKLSRQHNNANVICMGRRILSLDACKAMLDIWLDTHFEAAERHQRRVNKMG